VPTANAMSHLLQCSKKSRFYNVQLQCSHSTAAARVAQLTLYNAPYISNTRFPIVDSSLCIRPRLLLLIYCFVAGKARFNVFWESDGKRDLMSSAEKATLARLDVGHHNFANSTPYQFNKTYNINSL